jgi:Flp pilus assembly pilin Flp
MPGLHDPLLRAQTGPTMAEYGLMIAVIAIVVIVATVLLGGDLSGLVTTSARLV